MLKSLRRNNRSKLIHSTRPVTASIIEGLEHRQLLSAAHGWFSHHGRGRVEQTITFSELPGGTTGAVATELDTLASTTFAATQKVQLGNTNGVETYSVRVSGTGTRTTYTVDVNGNPVTAPTHSTIAFGNLTSTVSAEFDAIASGLGLTDPASTANVNVVTSGSSSVFSVQLPFSSGSNWGRFFSVDSAGNPVGNEDVPFSALSNTLQTDLNNDAPSGATALSGTSSVHVQSVDGITLYSVTYTSTGTSQTVTINESGNLTSEPSSTSTTFSTLTSAVQTELQTLATADGYSTTIAGNTTVTQYTEANGNIVFAVTLPVTKTGGSGNTYTLSITVASDANGNPTVPPDDGGGFGGGGFGGGGFGFGRGRHRGWGF